MKLRRARGGTFFGALVMILAGCGGASQHDAALQSLKAEIREVRLAQDGLDRRMGDLEVRFADARDQMQAEEPEGALVDAREPVENDGAAPGAREPDSESDPHDRSSGEPMIHVIAEPSKTRPAGAKSSTRSPVRGPRGVHLAHSGIAVFDPAAKRAYQGALELARTNRCDDALVRFAAFLVRWPGHPLAENATYWRGECFFSQGELEKAKREFQGTLARFPSGNKTPDAWLKLALVLDKLGDETGAHAAAQRLAQDFPRTDAASRVPGRLRK